MKNTTPTVYGEYLQHCQYTGAPFELVEHTTLNEKKGVLAGVYPPANQLPKIGWLAIGNQGHRGVNEGVQSWNTGRQHRPSDAAPFNMLPFHLRPLNNDLPQAQRAMYGLRKVEQYGGIDYVAYYLKKLDMSNVRPAMVIIERINGVENIRPFVPSSSNLNPTPVDLAPEEVLSANGQKLGTRSVIPVILSVTEIQAIIDACRIMYDNAMLAEISEMCLVSGVEYITQGTATGGGVIEYTEVIAAQVCSHLITHYSLPFVNNQVREDMVLGTSNPLLGDAIP